MVKKGYELTNFDVWHGICKTYVITQIVPYHIMHTNILLIEDDINLRTVLADYLLSKEYTVETAADGAEGWELMNKKHFDIIITNIMMPNMNGWQLLKVKQDANNLVPIIIISSKNSREDIQNRLK